MFSLLPIYKRELNKLFDNNNNYSIINVIFLFIIIDNYFLQIIKMKTKRIYWEKM